VNSKTPIEQDEMIDLLQLTSLGGDGTLEERFARLDDRDLRDAVGKLGNQWDEAYPQVKRAVSALEFVRRALQLATEEHNRRVAEKARLPIPQAPDSSIPLAP